MEFNGPTDGQVDALKQLADLNTAIRELVQSVATTGNGNWLGVADQLERVADRLRTEDRMATELRLLEERKAP